MHLLCLPTISTEFYSFDSRLYSLLFMPHSTGMKYIKDKTKTQISSFWLTYLFYFAAPRTFPRKRSDVWSAVRWYSMSGVVCLLKRPALHPQPHHRGRSAPRERTSPITETGTKRSLALHHSGPPKKNPSIYRPTLPQPGWRVCSYKQRPIVLLTGQWIGLQHKSIDVCSQT